jgi:predicted dehydrogenase
MKLGMAGLGWWGATLLDSIHDSAQLQAVSAYTRSRSEADQALAATHALRLADSYEALLADPGVEGVVLATPPTGHRAQLLAAIAAGKHVFCEKPFVMSRAEAVEVAAAAGQKGVTLGLGYARRFHPSWIDLKRRIHAGELGTILHAECTMSGPNGLVPNARAWRGSAEQAPCGGLFPMGVHAIDGFIDLFGGVQSAYCQSFRRASPNQNDDTTSILLRMQAGMSAYLGTMMATAGSFRFQVYGSKAMALLGGAVHVAGQSSEHRRTRLFASYTLQPVKGEAQQFEVPPCDISRSAMEAFATAAAGGAPFPITREDMVGGVAATDAIIASSRSGRPEPVAAGG